MPKPIQKSIRIEERLAKEISHYARENKMNFSQAIADLCARSLHNEFDIAYAPTISRVIKDSDASQMRQIEWLFSHFEDELNTHFLSIKDRLESLDERIK